MADQHVVESTDKASLRRRAAADIQPGSAGQDATHPLLRLQSQVGNASIARLIAQRQAEDDELQAKHEDNEVVGVEGGPVGPDTASRIQAMRGGGAPLEDGTRASMEASFRTSFDDVRVHADSQSDTLNRRLTAHAFTTGSDIFLRGDASASDGRLMAHELSHVVQQRSMSGGGAMRVGAADDGHEQHADSIADTLSAAPSSGAPATVAQRAGEEDELQASHDLAQREGEEDELQASHDLAQRAGEEDELQASHDLAQRAGEEDELMASHDLAQREGEADELLASHDLAQRAGEEDELMASHDLAQRAGEEDELMASHDLSQREGEQVARV
jgi:hypothetical protein